MSILGYRALTKIQSAALVAIVLVAAVSGGAAYVLWSGSQSPQEDIRIGICGDLDMPFGKAAWQGAVLAAEQVNAEGGVLGRNLTIVAEDDDNELGGDLSVATNALTKLITVDKADCIITTNAVNIFTFQDVCAQQEKILFNLWGSRDEIDQRVLDDYDKYKYSFSVGYSNLTAAIEGCTDCLLTLRNYTGFNKIALLDQDASFYLRMRTGINESLTKYGFDIVYQNSATWMTTDFTSYFAAIEASGAEILFPMFGSQAAVSFVKEWCDRQSPFVLWGSILVAEYPDFWELTEGKCEYVSFVGLPPVAGYPLTNKSLATREAYLERWGEIPLDTAVAAYDAVRFILPDAIKRAGTTETEAMIKALEATDVETSLARHFVFTSAHGIMIGSAGPNKPSMDYMLVCLFQWQSGAQVPVYPEEIMEEAGATYKYPPWRGVWSD